MDVKLCISKERTQITTFDNRGLQSAFGCKRKEVTSECETNKTDLKEGGHVVVDWTRLSWERVQWRPVATMAILQGIT
jgi:hypothetical protein